MRALFTETALGAVFLALSFSTNSAAAHGFAGDRFFPATIETDDPFVADEGSLPTVTADPTARDGTHETDFEADLSKRLTRDLDVTFQDQWDYVRTPGMPARAGLDTLTTGAQYQLFIDAPHEAMALIGAQASWAHTGRVQGLGAADFTTLSPVFDFGKGFGDLPAALPYLRPFAITGNLSVSFPTKTASNGNPNPNDFDAGFAIEYSIEYLEHHVVDLGLGAPFDRMIPLVEITSATALNRASGGTTTGLVAPGIIWAGQYYQIGGEVLLPYGNSAQGHGIGGLVQLHFFLDDLFPNTIGKPLLGD